MLRLTKLKYKNYCVSPQNNESDFNDLGADPNFTDNSTDRAGEDDV